MCWWFSPGYVIHPGVQMKCVGWLLQRSCHTRVGWVLGGIQLWPPHRLRAGMVQSDLCFGKL